MGDFAIVAEGITDQIVLRNILQAWFHEREDLLTPFVQPPNDATGLSAEKPHGGWGLVIAFFEKQEFLQALQTNSYLVTQLDTDVAADYGVPLSPNDPAMVEAVIAKLLAYVPDEIKQLHGHRFLFAIGHQSTECWLLPLVIDQSLKAKLKKTVGCAATLNEAYKRLGKPVIASDDNKDPDEYDRLSGQFSKPKDVSSASRHNVGFSRFVEQLKDIELS
jgi:hypothetical protein